MQRRILPRSGLALVLGTLWLGASCLAGLVPSAAAGEAELRRSFARLLRELPPAELGAEATLGGIYLTGRLGRPDPELGALWLELGAERGQGPAIYLRLAATLAGLLPEPPAAAATRWRTAFCTGQVPAALAPEQRELCGTAAPVAPTPAAAPAPAATPVATAVSPAPAPEGAPASPAPDGASAVPAPDGANAVKPLLPRATLDFSQAPAAPVHPPAAPAQAGPLPSPQVPGLAMGAPPVRLPPPTAIDEFADLPLFVPAPMAAEGTAPGSLAANLPPLPAPPAVAPAPVPVMEGDLEPPEPARAKATQAKPGSARTAPAKAAPARSAPPKADPPRTAQPRTAQPRTATPDPAPSEPPRTERAAVPQGPTAAELARLQAEAQRAFAESGAKLEAQAPARQGGDRARAAAPVPPAPERPAKQPAPPMRVLPAAPAPQEPPAGTAVAAAPAQEPPGPPAAVRPDPDPDEAALLAAEEPDEGAVVRIPLARAEAPEPLLARFEQAIAADPKALAGVRPHLGLERGQVVLFAKGKVGPAQWQALCRQFGDAEPCQAGAPKG